MRDRERWSGVAKVYRQSFAQLCAGTVETVVADLGSPGSGPLLDAGCGTGNVSRRAAGAGWAVTAVDADEQMLAVARAWCAGLPVRWVRGALPRLGLRSGVFEAVVANFVVNCVSDPRAAVGELARVVRPGGVVALTVWVSGRTAQATLLAEAFRAAQAVPVPGEGLPAEVDFERTVPGLAALACEAGLEPVRSRELAWDWAVSWDDWWAGIAGGVGSTGQTYLAQDPPTRERVHRYLRGRADELEADGMLRLPSVAAYVLARRA